MQSKTAQTTKAGCPKPEGMQCNLIHNLSALRFSQKNRADLGKNCSVLPIWSMQDL